MFCWSCGEQLKQGGERCGSCGAPTGAFVTGEPRIPIAARSPVSMCPGCGYLGEGMPYFRRSSHAVLLVGASLLTYGVGGLIYWLVKRDALVCPSCGLSWDRARQLEASSLGEKAADPGLWLQPARIRPEGLPRGGLVRRAAGVILAILAVFLLGIGIVEATAGTVVVGISIGLVGASSFAWGWRALHQRREGLLQSLQTGVLRVAAARGGRLTATDVASDLGVTLPAAERVLFSMDDGFRVRSKVTDEGLLVFDFPEIQVRSLSEGKAHPSTLRPTEPTED